MFTSLRGKKSKPLSKNARLQVGEQSVADHSNNANTISLVSGNLVVGSSSGNTFSADNRGSDILKNNGLFVDTTGRSSELTLKTIANKQSGANCTGKIIHDRTFEAELLYHELSRYPDNLVMLDLSLFPNLKEGDLCELKTYYKTKHSTTLKKNIKIYFIAKNLAQDLRKRHHHKSSNVSVATGQLQALLDVPARSTVWLKKKDKKLFEIDLVELSIKDVLLNRGDMWCISSKILGSCVFSEQTLTVLDSIRCKVSGIYRDGKKVLSGYIGENSRVIFRSESAKLLFVIQITEEMWNFEETGEQYFQKMVNSLLPNIFKKWKEKDTHHIITIAFAGSMDMSEKPFEELRPGEKLNTTTDFYRIVADQVSIVHWVEVMKILREEFMKLTEELKNICQKHEEKAVSVIKGRFSPVLKSNILELVNFATTLLTDPFRQVDLRHTTFHVILISAGSGFYDVDFDLLKLTGKKLMSMEMTMDLICLSRAPLHVVPLFRYLDYNDKLHHCSPSWLSIFFWNDSSNSQISEWKPKCKIYTLQMMGLTDHEVIENVDIDYLLPPNNVRSISEFIDNYDLTVFEHCTVKNEVYPENASTVSTPCGDANSNVTPAENSKTLKNHKGMAWNPNKFASPALDDIQKLTVSGDLYHHTIGKVTVSESRTTSKGARERILSQSDANSSLAMNTLKDINKKSRMKNLLSKLFTTKLVTDWSGNSGVSPVEELDKSLPESNDKLELSPKNNSSSKKFSNANEPIIKKNLDSLEQLNDGKGEAFKNVNYTIDKEPYVHSFAAKNVSGDNSDKISKINQKVNRLDLVDSKQIVKKLCNETWSEIENPSIPVSNEIAGVLLSVRWRGVLPKYVAKKYSKWRSFTTPAELPLTITSFPSIEEFRSEYLLRNHSVALNIEQELYGETFKSLFMKMIYIRLVSGFQLCIGPEVEAVESFLAKDKYRKQVLQYLPKDDYTNAKMYLRLDSEIHRITCGLKGSIDVERYIKNEEQNLFDQVPSYLPLVKTRYETQYRISTLDPLHASRSTVNWNQIDQILGGYADYEQNEQWVGFRAKFVILPSEVLPNTHLTVVNGRNETLSPEELRLEGIRRLIAFISRSRLRTTAEKKRRSRKDEIQPEISFYTGNLYDFLSEQKQALKLAIAKDSLFVNFRGKLTKTVDLKTLSKELQSGEDKLVLVNRKWHWRNFEHCFVGSELVSWLIRNFQDLETREKALEYGQHLMEKKLFVHALNKHGFLDGHYFYQLTSDYVLKPDVDEINIEPQETEIKLEGKKSKGLLSNVTTETSMSTGKSSLSSVTGDKRNTKSGSKPSVILSNSIVIDVDEGNKSSKQETCVIHYDKVHNPDHCFHIRCQWLTATPKLIDDLINNWSRLCERYGLTLIEVPWEELCSIPLKNPFHSFMDVELVLDPWKDKEFSTSDALKHNKFYFHIHLLKKLGFLLDNRTFSFLNDEKADFDVAYSWGRPMFKNAQYIHNTGYYISEIKERGTLFFAPNNIHIARMKGNLVKKNKKVAHTVLDANEIILQLQKKCLDEVELRKLFREAQQLWLEQNKVQGPETPY